MLARKLCSAVLLVAFAAGCASREPVVMGSQFAPPGSIRWLDREAKGEPACRVNLATIHDVRGDKQSMGTLGNRPVRISDSTVWLRSGFETMRRDSRILLVEPGDADLHLALSIELLQAHIASVNMAKTANVAVRVKFAPGAGDASEKLFRGETADVNWASGDGEALDVMNAALSEVVFATHAEVIAQCGRARARRS